MAVTISSLKKLSSILLRNWSIVCFFLISSKSFTILVNSSDLLVQKFLILDSKHSNFFNSSSFLWLSASIAYKRITIEFS